MAALVSVADVAELWGAQWQREGSGGRLTLPVTAGLRRGRVSGALSAAPHGCGLKLQFEPRESEYHLVWPAVAFLVLASAGGLFSMVWPFFAHRRPELLEAAPLAFFLAVGGWLLVVSRLRNSGPEEFLEEVAGRLTPSDGGE
ncbi:MAG: hypothetical protein KDD47_15050 [Acidobacteria bacterium]|nr:hypothetical protein [Acidobacteriota bacterium]